MTTIKLKNGSGAPAGGDLVQGEPALDLTNKRLYTENASGTVIEVGTNPTSVTTGDVVATSLDISGNIDVDGTTNLDVVDIDGAVDMASTLAVGGVVTANAGVVVDNITIDGQEIDVSSGNLTLDVAGETVIDSGSSGILRLKVSGTDYGMFFHDNTHMYVQSNISDGDMVFRGKDGGSTITALTLDMSAAGAATFNAGATFASSVGIGTTSPNTTLHLSGLTGSPPKLTLEEGGAESRIYGTKNSPTNSDLRFQTEISGTIADRMIIDYSGRVGIGTSSPAYPLHLKTSAGATALFASGGSSDDIQLRFQQNNTFVGAVGYDASEGAVFLNRYGNATVGLTVDSNNNVGIGTSSPNASADLHVADTSDTRIWVQATSGDTAELYAGTGVSLFNRSNSFLNFGTNNTERMRLDSSGNLLVGKTDTGIGTQGVFFGPNYSHITSTNDTPLALSRKSSDGTILDLRKDGTTVGSIGTDNGSLTVSSSASGKTGLYFASGGLLPMNSGALDGSDQVNIGSSSYQFKDLYLSGGVNLNTASTNATITMARGTNGQNNMLKFSTGGTDDWIVGQRNDGTSDFRFYSYGTSSDAVSITRTGNLLVGITSTSSQMSVKASSVKHVADWQNFNDGGYGFNFKNASGSIVGTIAWGSSSTSYNTSSDQRLKDNIVDAPSASDDIDAIQVRSFDWKADGSHQKYGMVAQELQTAAPEAVSAPEDPEEMMGVDYSKLVPMLVKEIQSLRARVAQLETN